MGNKIYTESVGSAENEIIVHECTVKEEYFNYIKSGKKTVEGRINTGKFATFKKGDRLKFLTSNETITCEILDVNKYENFKDMLTVEGVRNCLPNVSSVPKGVQKYHQIPNYKERAREFGVLAIKIKLLAEQV